VREAPASDVGWGDRPFGKNAGAFEFLTTRHIISKVLTPLRPTEILLAAGSRASILHRTGSTTPLLGGAATGDPHAAADLLPLVHDELRKLAAAHLADEKPGQTLQATALVHEAYLRFLGPTRPCRGTAASTSSASFRFGEWRIYLRLMVVKWHCLSAFHQTVGLRGIGHLPE
jgi:hypothetical protein